MTITPEFLDQLTEQAKASPRLRMNYDMRTPSGEPGVQSRDGSQRMLNALEPGTEVPVHRHPATSETVVMLRGRGVQYFYNDRGEVTEEVLMEAGGPCQIMSVEAGRWHRLVSLESGTVIFECKDGAFEPRRDEDVLNL